MKLKRVSVKRGRSHKSRLQAGDGKNTDHKMLVRFPGTEVAPSRDFLEDTGGAGYRRQQLDSIAIAIWSDDSLAQGTLDLLGPTIQRYTLLCGSCQAHFLCSSLIIQKPPSLCRAKNSYRSLQLSPQHIIATLLLSPPPL